MSPAENGSPFWACVYSPAPQSFRASRSHARNLSSPAAAGGKKTGHWTYECKGTATYKARVSRTKILENPALKPKFNLDVAPIKETGSAVRLSIPSGSRNLSKSRLGG